MTNLQRSYDKFMIIKSLQISYGEHMMMLI